MKEVRPNEMHQHVNVLKTATNINEIIKGRWQPIESSKGDLLKRHPGLEGGPSGFTDGMIHAHHQTR